MKKFSKFLSGAMALAMAACMSVPAFAADVTDVESNNTANADVTATATEKVTAGDEYLVTITFPDLTFTYSFGNDGSWNTADLQYDGVQAAGWSETTKTINLSNSSNVGVTVTGSYAAEADYTAITGGFTDDKVQLGEADTQGTSGKGEIQTGTMEFKIGGTPASAFTSQKVGTITLTVSKTVAE